jgi:hypothetical protein
MPAVDVPFPKSNAPGSVPSESAGNYVLVSPAAGSQVAVQQYPSTPLPFSNSVDFLDGYLLFTTRDGFLWASGVNTTDVSALSFARAEARPDGLLRGITYGESYLAMGDQTIEVWTDVAAIPFPLQRTAVIPIGLLGQWAVAGSQDGWAEALIFVASDGSVRRLDGYTPTRISPAELDRLIGLADPTKLVATVYTFGQNAIWSLSSGTDWTWEYNVTTGAWHERQSQDMTRWRATRSVNAFGKWIFGDLGAADFLTIDLVGLMENGDPLTWGMDSAPVKQFPVRIAVPDVSFDFAMGQAPLGIAKHPGIMFRFRISDPVYTSFAGARASAVPRRQ